MDKYTLQPSTDKGWWVVTDTENGIVCKFQEGRFNDTQHITFLNDIDKPNALQIAHILRGIADWLVTNHSDIVIGNADDEADRIHDELLMRARETVEAWVTENWRQVIGTPEEILDKLIHYDMLFCDLWEEWCDDHGWEEGDCECNYQEHPDYKELLTVIRDSQARIADMSGRQLIGMQIGELRAERGLTQGQLAELTGLHYSNIRKIEAGKYNVSVDILHRIAKALGAKLTLERE